MNKKYYSIIALMFLAIVLVIIVITTKTNKEDEISSDYEAIYSKSTIFTDRDLKQNVDKSSSVSYNVTSDNDIHITKEGVYVISGTAENSTIYVEAGSEEKVQIVLNGVNMTNTDFPCIYVKTGDKVFITTSEDSSLSVTGDFVKDGDIKTNGVIYSKSDIVLNGTAELTINSNENGIVGKDDVKITGGTYNIIANSKCIDANDSIAIADGIFNLTAGTDGIHSENNDDDKLGYIYICGGTFNISATDDAIHGTSVVQIDGGTINIKADEGIEGTYIQINDGNVAISDATGDGINSGSKSNSYDVVIEINGGEITISVTDTGDGIDSNGNIYINGGKISVTGKSTFDYTGEAKLNGGDLIINEEKVTAIPESSISD